VRAEEKELEGPELEREEQLQEESARDEEQLPDLGGEALRDIELEHRSTLFDAIRLVLAGEHVTVSLLYLPQRETHALEALQAAVSGQDSVGEFVFAEDRRALLEQSLAVLQQNVTHGKPEQLAELHAKFDELTERVGELRHRLLNLEDAQEELLGSELQHGKAVSDEGDKGDGGGGDGADAASAASAALDGPERPVAPKPPSTLAGDAPPETPRPASTLAGDAPPEAPRPASTLVGDAPPEAPRPASTLVGDAPPEAPKPPSELAAEATEAEAQKPWWRRPFE
jgi:hypothetical protein